jgi:rubredoxin
MRCETCGEYIYKGKKFNARKETVAGEMYHSIKIFRFYIKCPRCSAEITFKTDPKNTDYVAEHGANRNFEPWRDESKESEKLVEDREKEEENNPLKALENRTLDSKREMDILDALDEIKTRNARNEKVDAESVLQRMIDSDMAKEIELQRMIEEEDNSLASSVYRDDDGEIVKRVNEADNPLRAVQEKYKAMTKLREEFSEPKKRKPTSQTLGVVVKKKQTTPARKEEEKPGTSLASLVAYSDGTESDESS